MPKPPLSTLPLESSPYHSRISNQYNSTTPPKNYYIHGFNPGFALQASELNEVQELFYLNQSLSLRMNSLWSNKGYKVPFWEGLVPLDPTYVDVTNISQVQSDNISLTASFAPGWYLWTDVSSRLSFWIYNNTGHNSTFTTTSGDLEFIGFIVYKNNITCCQAFPCVSGSDDTLRDNSRGLSTTTEYTCGASRLQAKFDTVARLSTNPQQVGNDGFYPILRVRIGPTSNGTNGPIVQFGDQQTFITT